MCNPEEIRAILKKGDNKAAYTVIANEMIQTLLQTSSDAYGFERGHARKEKIPLDEAFLAKFLMDAGYTIRENVEKRHFYSLLKVMRLQCEDCTYWLSTGINRKEVTDEDAVQDEILAQMKGKIDDCVREENLIPVDLACKYQKARSGTEKRERAENAQHVVELLLKVRRHEMTTKGFIFLQRYDLKTLECICSTASLEECFKNNGFEVCYISGELNGGDYNNGIMIMKKPD